ncbi:hypothetical protein OG332_42155 [Streptomyces sp. NBC_01233]|nr:hypothetical protein OG332_42155 [Streptomyces sp. NBC_01233]
MTLKERIHAIRHCGLGLDLTEQRVDRAHLIRLRRAQTGSLLHVLLGRVAAAVHTQGGRRRAGLLYRGRSLAPDLLMLAHQGRLSTPLSPHPEKPQHPGR